MTNLKKEHIQEGTKYSPFLILFLGLLTALTPLSIDMYLPALPMMPEVFQTSPSNIQLTLSMTVTGIAIGQLFGGPISDIFGRKRPLIIGNLLCALATLACALSQSIEGLLFARFLAGFMGSIGVVISKAVARDLANGKALAKLLSLLMVVNGLAPVVAPLIGGQILVFGSWRLVFIVLTMIAVMLFLMSLVYKETLPPDRRQSKDLNSVMVAYQTLFRDRQFMGQCLVQGFGFEAFFAYISGSAFVYQNIYGLDAQTFSYVFGINSLGIVIASSLGGRASNVVSSKHMLQFALWQLGLGSLLFLLAIKLEAPFILVAISLFIAATSISNISAFSFSLALKDHGKIAGAASALLGFFSMIFAGLMAPIIGIQGDHNAIPMAITMVVCIAIALLALYGLVLRKGQED